MVRIWLPLWPPFVGQNVTNSPPLWTKSPHPLSSPCSTLSSPIAMSCCPSLPYSTFFHFIPPLPPPATLSSVAGDFPPMFLAMCYWACCWNTFYNWHWLLYRVPFTETPEEAHQHRLTQIGFFPDWSRQLQQEQLELMPKQPLKNTKG